MIANHSVDEGISPITGIEINGGNDWYKRSNAPAADAPNKPDRPAGWEASSQDECEC
jgi:hypothetical protein